jgi:ATP-dependent Lon protease
MLPARNQKDLEDVPDTARKQVRFVWLEQVDDAIAAALNPPGEESRSDAAASAESSTNRRAARSR